MMTLDPYDVLGVDRSAGREQIRKAYRALIVKHHPDKLNAQSNSSDRTNDASVSQVPSHAPIAFDEFASQLNEAYRVLSDPLLRETYDRDNPSRRESGSSGLTYNASSSRSKSKTRPMRVIDLDLFEYHEREHQDQTPTDGEDKEFIPYYTYPCRCSALFVIDEEELEDGVDMIECEGCGERIAVGYEEVNEDNEGQDQDQRQTDEADHQTG